MKKLSASSLLFLAIVLVFGAFSYLTFAELLYDRSAGLPEKTPFFAFETGTDTENRAKAALPRKIGFDFSRNFDAFYNDAFPLRSFFIKRFHSLKKKIKDNPKVIAGLDNWMFYNSSPESVYAKTGNILGDFTGKTLLNGTDEQSFTRHMACQGDYFKKRGVRFIVMVPPNRMPLYSEFLPDAYRKQEAPFGRYEQIREILKGLNIEFLDLKTFFKQKKSEDSAHQLFYKTDTHWTPLGAYYGFGELTRTTGYEQPAPVGVKREILSCGDVYKVSSAVMKTCFDIRDIPELPETEFKGHCDFSKAPKHIVCKNDKAPVQKNVLIVRDSMFDFLYDEVARSFKNTVLLWRSMHTEQELFDEIEAFDADIVVYEQGERFMLEMQNEAICPNDIVKIDRLNQRPKDPEK